MFAKIEELEARYEELEANLGRPEIIRDQKAYQSCAKERRALAPIVNAFREFKSLTDQIQANRMLLDDPDADIRHLAREEMDVLQERISQVERELKILLIPTDPNDEKNILLEIRAGTGGEEAALFAADLFRMYSRYAELKGWKTEVLSQHQTGIGGIKEIIVLVEGEKVYSRLKYESGVHRVQRVPETETQGRIHTSAVTVAILPEAEEIDVEIAPQARAGSM